MFLKGKKISLRALEPSDADLLYRWENNTELWPVSFTQVPFSHFMLEEFVNSVQNDIYTNKQLRLMAVENKSGETMGTLDLFEFDPQHDRTGVGIYIHKDHRKKGAAAEAIGLIKDYCFTILHLKQLFVHVNEANAPSLALFEKAGFKKTGIKKSWFKTGMNKYEDVWFLQCINKG